LRYDAGMASVMFVITDLHRGGSPLLLAELAPGLARRGWDVEVVSIAPEGEVAGLLRERGLKVTSLEARFSKDVTAVARFVSLVKRRQAATGVDIVCSVLVHANLLAAMAMPFLRRRGGGRKIKWVQSIHTLQPRPAWHWTLQGRLSGRAEAMVAPSQAVIEKLRQHGPVPGATVIPNGIDVRRFYEARPMENVPWPKGVQVVGYVGRFDPVKRLAVVVEAMRELKHWHLALVGYGAQEGVLRAQVAGLGLAERVHFVGATKEPERWYKTFDVFCSPSAVEGYGLTLAEAVAAGLPVVACNTAAVRETVSEAIWVSAEVGAGELARAIEQSCAEQKRPMSLAELEKRYSLERMVERYGAFLSALNVSEAPSEIA